ncbi:MAG TPA: hypothetical protein VFD41_10945 [Actinomycetales bacterium]|nr:hypothetical protein [Actinomycetales bacterium]
MTGPLEGTLVVDLTRALAGPHAGMMLGDLLPGVQPQHGVDRARPQVTQRRRGADGADRAGRRPDGELQDREGDAANEPEEFCRRMGRALQHELVNLLRAVPAERAAARYERYRHLGR